MEAVTSDISQDAIGQVRRCLAACVMTDGELYTSVAERIDPGSAVELINRYLAALFRPVYEHGGFVADLKGDGMLAVWTADDYAAEAKRRACLACLEIAESAQRFSRVHPIHGFGTRIGACFGPIALAALGTPAHLEYRAVGDTVNTSSRLEQLNKLLHTRILVCANLAEGMEQEILFRDLGHFQLRGKRNRVHVYEPLSLQATATVEQRVLCSAFAEATAHYRQGRVERAVEALRELRHRFPTDGPARFYLDHYEWTAAARQVASVQSLLNCRPERAAA